MKSIKFFFALQKLFGRKFVAVFFFQKEIKKVQKLNKFIIIINYYFFCFSLKGFFLLTFVKAKISNCFGRFVSFCLNFFVGFYFHFADEKRNGK